MARDQYKKYLTKKKDKKENSNENNMGICRKNMDKNLRA